MSLSDDILRDNAAILDRMLGHRFVEDVCADRLPTPVFHHYLAYEGAFVETAIGIFAFATARAPDLETRRWLIAVQDALANTQVPYFEGCAARLSLPAEPVKSPAARQFDTRMHDLAAQGDFAEIVTAMFAAEWMYWTWCSRAACAYISDPDLKAWVELHVDPAFEAQARWLKAAIDRYGAPQDRPALSRIFHDVTAWEIAFHDAPYDAMKESAA
ncbi:TenA family transcriptional regulator [Meridianimarinicoccus roseus]|jgi:thiaminase/transcriptional activator TenA|uniref:Aminopyrimidine aminohydrolase n=1 Tax=Meridianimarinicoccus roseus TaxID=2072018 RepID=A0A2V2LAE1_9RHOB|nr:TenA family protein [Meridianimarinicoccus roseus]PWR02430.1 TenA family transcriptional regulator [Meridianimarinicoccus roseus]